MRALAVYWVIFLLMVFSSHLARAQSPASTSNGLEVCFTGMAGELSKMQYQNFEDYFQDQAFRSYYASQMTCESLKKVRFGISTAVFTLTLSSIYVGATGVGIPVSVGIGLTSASLSYLNFVVSQMDCQQDKEDFKKKVTEAICETLNGSEISCDPKSVKTFEFGDLNLMCRGSI